MPNELRTYRQFQGAVDLSYSKLTDGREFVDFKSAGKTQARFGDGPVDLQQLVDLLGINGIAYTAPAPTPDPEPEPQPPAGDVGVPSREWLLAQQTRMHEIDIAMATWLGQHDRAKNVTSSFGGDGSTAIAGWYTTFLAVSTAAAELLQTDMSVNVFVRNRGWVEVCYEQTPGTSNDWGEFFDAETTTKPNFNPPAGSSIADVALGGYRYTDIRLSSPAVCHHGADSPRVDLPARKGIAPSDVLAGICAMRIQRKPGTSGGKIGACVGMDTTVGEGAGGVGTGDYRKDWGIGPVLEAQDTPRVAVVATKIQDLPAGTPMPKIRGVADNREFR